MAGTESAGRENVPLWRRMALEYRLLFPHDRPDDEKLFLRNWFIGWIFGVLLPIVWVIIAPMYLKSLSLWDIYYQVFGSSHSALLCFVVMMPVANSLVLLGWSRSVWVSGVLLALVPVCFLFGVFCIILLNFAALPLLILLTFVNQVKLRYWVYMVVVMCLGIIFMPDIFEFLLIFVVAGLLGLIPFLGSYGSMVLFKVSFRESSMRFVPRVLVVLLGGIFAYSLPVVIQMYFTN